MLWSSLNSENISSKFPPRCTCVCDFPIIHRLNWYLSLPPTRQDLTQSQWPKGRFKMGIRRGESRARVEAQTLLNFAGHRLTYCHVSLMNLAGHGPKHWLRHGCLIIAWTGQRGPVLFLLVNNRLYAAKILTSPFTHRLKRWITCEHINYRDTSNHSRYLPRLEVLQSRDISIGN